MSLITSTTNRDSLKLQICQNTTPQQVFFIVEHFGSVYIGTNYQIWEQNFRKELNCQNFCDYVSSIYKASIHYLKLTYQTGVNLLQN